MNLALGRQWRSTADAASRREQDLFLDADVTQEAGAEFLEERGLDPVGCCSRALEQRLEAAMIISQKTGEWSDAPL